MPSMSREEITEFLQGPLLARLATLKADGAPLVVPVWFEHDGRHIFLVARKRSAWVAHLKRDCRVSLVIDEDKLPYRKVIIEGEGRVTGTNWVRLGRRMAMRYFGDFAYLDASMDQPRYVIKITPQKITSWRATGRGDYSEWHPRYIEPGSAWQKALKKARGIQ